MNNTNKPTPTPIPSAAPTEDYKVVGTHLSIPMWRRFRRTLDRSGVTIYTAFQNFAEVVVRMGDDRHNLTPDMEMLMSAFEHLQDWSKNFNLSDPTTKPEITEATYYLREPNHRGARVVHVERPFFGQWSQTLNTAQILEKFICLTFPKLYLRMRSVAVSRGHQNVLALLIDIINEAEAEEVKRELRQPFEDAERSEWGRTPATQPYKIHHRRTPDGEAQRQMMMQFTDEDLEAQEEDDDGEA